MTILLSYFGIYLNELQFIEKGDGDRISCAYAELLPIIFHQLGSQIRHVLISIEFLLFFIEKVS